MTLTISREKADVLDLRIVGCENCGTEGKLYAGQYEDERCIGDCPVCDGTGGEIIQVQPVTLEDLMEHES